MAEKKPTSCPGTGPDFGELFAPALSSWDRNSRLLAVLGSAQELGLILESSLPLLPVSWDRNSRLWRSWVLPRNWA